MTEAINQDYPHEIYEPSVMDTDSVLRGMEGVRGVDITMLEVPGQELRIKPEPMLKHAQHSRTEGVSQELVGIVGTMDENYALLRYGYNDRTAGVAREGIMLARMGETVEDRAVVIGIVDRDGINVGNPDGTARHRDAPLSAFSIGLDDRGNVGIINRSGNGTLVMSKTGAEKFTNSEVVQRSGTFTDVNPLEGNMSWSPKSADVAKLVAASQGSEHARRPHGTRYERAKGPMGRFFGKQVKVH